MMKLRCPTCNYDLTNRATEMCPECGTVSSEKQLRAWAREAAHPHPRADIAGHGCAIVFCLFTAAISAQIAVGYGATHMLFVAVALVLFAFGLGLSLRRVQRRWRALRDVD